MTFSEECRLKVLFGGDFGWALFWPIQAVSMVGELLCDVGTPLLSPNKSTQGHLTALVLSPYIYGQFISRLG